ncbi:hypothetical protein C7Y72_04150 [Paraconexibacter algicola]|uniref:Uncharacterized protein n=1 Tax=Paraconexibacter algicola TaxID=2133960 RepID=A0A2T4UI34_9ACTN|nr:hypothetical protein C7Y72_04150 [Paraconexibacter algicola]
MRLTPLAQLSERLVLSPARYALRATTLPSRCGPHDVHLVPPDRDRRAGDSWREQDVQQLADRIH